MSYKLSIIDDKGVSFNVKYENLAKAKKPPVEAKNSNGDIVREKSVYQGQVLGPGSTQRKWTDDQGNFYNKTDLTFWYEGEQVEENSQTKTFQIEGYQALENYTDSYVISTYYELFPHNNDMKKDFDKQRAVISNMTGMKKLWDYLYTNKLVARGEMCISSKGFIASDAYIRAVKFGNKWILELGIFKEEKIFDHLQEEIPLAPVQSDQTKKRLKMV